MVTSYIEYTVGLHVLSLQGSASVLWNKLNENNELKTNTQQTG